MTSRAPVIPVESYVDTLGIEGLDSNSYTAHRLKHASAEHLDLTTRRFFIGPIPEGWLNSNRKSWYRRRLELSSFSSRRASFTAAAGQGRHDHHRTMTGLDGPSTAARMGFSFPQPEDVHDATSSHNSETGIDVDTEEDDGGEEDNDIETRYVAPVATNDLGQLSEIGAEDNIAIPVSVSHTRSADQKSTRSSEAGPSHLRDPGLPSKSPGADTFTTAREQYFDASDTDLLKQLDARPYPDPDANPDQGLDRDAESNVENRASDSIAGASSLHPHGLDAQADNLASHSRTRLLRDESPGPRPNTGQSGVRSLRNHDPAPVEGEIPVPRAKRGQSEGVRFKVSEAVVNRQNRMTRRVNSARSKVTTRLARRDTLRAGTIIKMERMLVKVEITMQQPTDEFDENESLKTDMKTLEKWREFMVVARKSKKGDDEDFRLQFYKTRVIPEIEDESTKKKPTREIRLIRRTTHVNLFSSLDKTVVIWHPYKKGTRVIVMRASSTAHSVEWYTFLRDALGWHRPTTLQVSVPDLDVALQIDRPFENLEAAGMGAEDEQTAISKTAEAEKAVAGRIVEQCVEMLKGNPEWAGVIQHWSDTVRMGLAWKRYDRLEWVHGLNEQKMYGSMAMQHSYDLELRPKLHYPTTAQNKKGDDLKEPPPIEGFLIRLTSQKGLHKRMGKAFFKRLYFNTQNQFLFFSRPAKATPPHPPRLQTVTGSNIDNIPSAREIVEKTPMTYDIIPFEVDEGQVRWLRAGQKETINRHDREAYEESRRNVANVLAADGLVDMRHIRQVRKLQWGATDADEGLDSGSDVDFHRNVSDTAGEDGVTQEIDDDRTFELVLDNGLVVRLQAYDEGTRDEWIRRLRRLVRYWKLRTNADMDTFKHVRKTNLQRLNIDEEMEAQLGQFGRKWEVNRSHASPEIYNMCSISSCRSIVMSGLLFRKPRRHTTFQRCGVILVGGRLLVFQDTVRKGTGEQVSNVHQDKIQDVDLQNCYIYSGLIVEDELLYQNRTFDANHMGVLANLPRVWIEDGWTSSDVDVMCCFVIWMNTRKGWFRTAGSSGGGGAKGGAAMDTTNDGERGKDGKRARIKRVGQLGVPGRGMVFKCRSRAERDRWVLSIAAEIDRVVERQSWEDDGDVRFG